MNFPISFYWLLAIVVATSYGEKIERPEPPVEQWGKYAIYIMKRAYADTQLNISASIFNATGVTHLTAELRETENKTVVASVEADLLSDSSQMLTMPVPVFMGYNSEIVVKGTGGLNFTDSKYIRFTRSKPEKKSHQIVIQTDKPLYKPSDRIQFRVFGIHADLQASKSPMNISIVDPQRNIMHRWINMIDKTGVISLDYELSDKPVLGTWMIKMKQEGQKERYQFKVKEYVLPNYKVIVEGEKNIPSLGFGYLFIHDEIIRVNVTAKYTFGKAVRGDLVLNATIDDSSDGLTLTFEKKIEGKSHIEFTMDDLVKTDVVKVSSYQRFCIPRKIKFSAMVTETLTGKKMYSEPFTMQIVNAPVKLDIRTPIVYKHGLPTIVYITVSRVDEKPLSETDREFPVKVIINHSDGFVHNSEYTIPQNGSIKFNLLIPNFKEGRVTLEAKYTGRRGSTKYEIKESVYPGIFSNLNNENVEAILLQERVNLGDDIKVLLNSTTPISWAVITTISNRKMLSNKIMKIGEKTNFVLEIPTSDIMIPSASVVISCVSSKGAFLVDASTAKIVISFKNDVVGTFTKEEGQPGSNVDFKVKTMPGSTVFVMAVDKNLHLLESAKYITEDMIYDSLVGSDNSNSWRRDVRNSGGVLRSVGLVLMTNFKIDKYIEMYFHHMSRTDDFRMGPASVPMSASLAPVPPRIRKFFPETWIWLAGEATESGEFSLSKNVPDSITRWQANAFAFHPEKGLGIMKESVEFLSFQEFFIVPVLPSYIIRGESFLLKVSIFSNLTQDQEVTVTLAGSDQFTLKDSENSQSVMVKAGRDNTVQFHVVPSEVGVIQFKILANCALAADEVHKTIIVKPEGYTLYFNEAFLLKIDDNAPATVDYVFKPKPDIVEDSERIEVSVIGDIMGPSIDNLDNLIRIPSGCGEQNMINFAPNIYIHDYLKATSKLTPEQFKMIKMYTLRGYKNELRYKRSDGSFSAFGQRDKTGSTWLTAFVLRCFGQARKSIPDIFIDEQVLRQGIHWLVGKRNKQNRFVEDGRVIHSAMQGQASHGVALTAYTLISLYENQDIMPNITTKLIQEVAASLPIHANDTYSLGMILYLMALTEDADNFEKIENILEEKAIKKDGMKYWETEDKTQTDNYYHSASTGVELASYVLMAYTHKGMIEEGMPIMKYIVSQRNSNGGLYSTQDTVLAHEAMSVFAENVKSAETLTVTVTNNDTDTHTFADITPDMSTILYKHVLPSNTNKIHISAEGKTAKDAMYTYAFVQIAWQYNIKLGSADNIFEGKAEYRALNSNEMALNICHRMKKLNLTGMIIIEASLPSGYYLTNKKQLLADDNISKVEIEDTEVVLYLNELDTSFSCHVLEAEKVFEINGHVSPLPVKIRLYYKPDLELVTMYEMTGGSE